MLQTSFETFRELARRGGVVPIVREFSADTLTPITAYAAVRRPPFGFLLESLVGGERWARYTFLGTQPREAWRYRDGRVERWTPKDGWSSAGSAPDPLAHLAEVVRPHRAVLHPGIPRFTGGAIGYFGFDVVRAFERLPGGPDDDLHLPDGVFLFTDTVVILDNLFARAIVVAAVHVDGAWDGNQLTRAYDDANARIDALLAELRSPPRLEPMSLAAAEPVSASSPFPADRFQAGVTQIKQHITEGDAFQIVLSRRLDLPCTAPPLDVYRALRTLNPAPYLFLLELDDMSLVGSSPEVLVRVEDGEVTVRPIAGTRGRGQSADEDTALTAELLADEKELAEHAMLVDLGRNDVGRVAEFGSVRVTVDREIERYSHVQHIVSEVRGRLAGEADAFDALRATFPAGTVSGAPKVRAMEILDALEPTRRGPYSGAVGYAAWGGRALDMAIAIRTAVLRDGRAHVQVGAGIVADSDPYRELTETEQKAQGVLGAIAMAHGRSQSPRSAGIFGGRGTGPS